MSPWWQSGLVTVYHGDCVEVMKELPDASIDSVCTDPPYGIGFMGKAWDVHAPLAFEQWCEAWARECLRVLKPGGHLLAFGGSRTWHRLAAGIEDAGFEIRDNIAWLYGSGFPKSLDVSKAIDKAAGATRQVVGVRQFADGTSARATAGQAGVPESGPAGQAFVTAPATSDAERWHGWGTALKPAFEPVVVARKPLAGTVAANVLAHGTGALNIDASRIVATDPEAYAAKGASVVGLDSNRNGAAYGEWSGARTDSTSPQGRWPANVILDEDAAAELDAQTPHLKGGTVVRRNLQDGTDKPSSIYGIYGNQSGEDITYGDSGGASRFFYVAKASARERPKGGDGTAHPTVKPLALMRYLVRLVTPPDGLVLDPFAGSGTTLEAARLEGFRVVGIEREDQYLPLIRQRLDKPHDVGLFGAEAAGVDL